MKPPFWEVSLCLLEPGQPIMIESIACFSDSEAMRRYVTEQRTQNPNVLVRTVYRTSIAPRQLVHVQDANDFERDNPRQVKKPMKRQSSDLSCDLISPSATAGL